MNAMVNLTELESVHLPLAKMLDKHRVVYRTWGAAGPDFLIEHNGVIIEAKRDDSLIGDAYREIMARAGHPKFDPMGCPYFVIATPNQFLIWENKGKYNPVEHPDIVFLVSEIDAFVEFLKKKEKNPRLYLDDHIEDVLKLIYSKDCPDEEVALISVLNLHKSPIVFTNRSIFFAPGRGEQEREVAADEETRGFLQKELFNKYIVRDADFVKEHLRHCWSHYQPDSKKAGLGKYYTPLSLVELIKNYVMPFLVSHPKAWVLDPAAGCGAFLAAFEDYHYLGRDIDDRAVLILREMGFHPEHVAVDNSLKGVSRKKYGIDEKDDLVIVGNPPYNDTSSFNKRYSTDKKAALDIEQDEDVKSRDLGLSFLRAYGKLEPDCIAVLHPLSYLIKKKNFDILAKPYSGMSKGFSQRYVLKKAFVFPSTVFGSDLANKTPFPVVAAFYEKGEMDYEYIKKFPFRLSRVHGNEIIPDERFLVLEKITTIDGIIRKYPPKSGMTRVSDIGVYQYNIRDTNSLITSGALSETMDENKIPVQFEELWKYAYLNCYKRYFGKDYIFGNLSPLFDLEKIDDEVFHDYCIVDTIMNNSRLLPMNPKNVDSFVVKKYLLADFKRKSRVFKENEVYPINVYQVFVDYWTNKGKEENRKILSLWFKEYFESLRNKMFLVE